MHTTLPFPFTTAFITIALPDLLFSSLKKLGLHEDKPDPILHDWKKLIDYFVKEL